MLMTVKVDTDWTYRDIRTVILENDLLKVVLMPDLGAKIWQITYKPRGKDLLWHNPRLKPRKLPFHSVYDDQFFGGWDELFPNDVPEAIEGEMFPDHGEIWTLPWQFAVEKAEGDEAVVRLWTDTPISACRVEKTITLRAGESKLRFRHRIVNESGKTLPFLWKLHAAMAVDENSRIDLPARSVYIDDFGSPRMGATRRTYTWPYVEDARGGTHDMRKALSSSSGVSEFQYATDTDAGWCAITHTKEKIGFALAYDAKVMPHCWLFASYGGWRGLNTVVLEPCTGYPYSVNEGMKKGTHVTLAPGQTLVSQVVASVYEGWKSIETVDADGNVTGKTEQEETSI
jgi:galactose mutarotase-like enzyme